MSLAAFKSYFYPPTPRIATGFCFGAPVLKYVPPPKRSGGEFCNTEKNPASLTALCKISGVTGQGITAEILSVLTAQHR